MNYKTYLVSAFVFLSFSLSGTNLSASKNNKKSNPIETKSSFDAQVAIIYNHLNSNEFELPAIKTFAEGLKGFYSLKERGIIKKDILTLIDFSLSSNKKRLWVIDLSTNTILIHSLVAHGRNTGEEFATNFSNTAQSFQSSLGFYATAEVYKGKHGLSLKLDGLEKGLNDKARERAVVIHGADYVSDSFIKGHNRLGRSQGCPAVPVKLANDLISAIKDKSCLFIYHPSRSGSKVI